MKVGKKNRNWLRAVAISAVLAPAGLATARQPSPLERAGRIAGVCWGDGYHACSDSGIRLGADLPPRSFTARARSKSHRARGGIVHRVGATFYDRFDASNGRHCDAFGGCDSLGAPQYPGPGVGVPVPEPYSPTPAAENNDSSPQSVPLAAPLANADSSAPKVKKYPTRPQPPESVARSTGIPVGAVKSNYGFDPNTADPPPPVATQTPATIAPSPSVVDQYNQRDPVIASNPLATSTPAMAMPPFMSSQPAPQPETKKDPPKVRSNAPFYVSIPPYPTVTPQPTESSPQSQPVPQTGPAQQTIPSYAKEPPMPPAAETATPQTSRPHRLGSKSAETPVPSINDQSTSATMRLGADSSVQVNPFLAKPAIELARRGFGSSDNVIYQPNSGSLK